MLHGVRHSWDLGYRSELRTKEQLSPRLKYFSIISRPAEEPAPWPGATGYVQEIWSSGELNKAWGFRPEPDDTHFLLCGNPQMCEGMVAALAERGFAEQTRKTPGQVHVERYW